MFKKFISHQPRWLLITTVLYSAVTSCKNANLTVPVDDANSDQLSTSIDSLASDADSESGYASGGASPALSSDDSYSGFSSANGSSSSLGPLPCRSPSPSFFPPSSPVSVSPPSPFAGLPNIGNSCYMNTVLQIIAALYENEVQDNPRLKDLVNKINTGSSPLDAKYINKFKNSLPEEAKTMAISDMQHDPAEFIEAIHQSGYFHTHPITIAYKENKDDQPVTKKVYKLRILSDWLTEESDLSQVIASSQKEKMESMKDSLGFYRNPFEDNQVDTIQDSMEAHIDEIVLGIPDKCCIELVRNGQDGCSKVSNPVTGTLHITIKPVPSEDQTIRLDLHGFILHAGDSATSGHYVAYVKRAGEWYKADDQNIIQVSASAAEDKSKEAYLLFYIKQ